MKMVVLFSRVGCACACRTGLCCCCNVCAACSLPAVANCCALNVYGQLLPSCGGLSQGLVSLTGARLLACFGPNFIGVCLCCCLQTKYRRTYRVS
jgi:hypothetical protein